MEYFLCKVFYKLKLISILNKFPWNRNSFFPIFPSLKYYKFPVRRSDFMLTFEDETLLILRVSTDQIQILPPPVCGDNISFTVIVTDDGQFITSPFFPSFFLYTSYGGHECECFKKMSFRCDNISRHYASYASGCCQKKKNIFVT